MDAELHRHIVAQGPIGGEPVPGGRVTLLPSGADALDAVFAAIGQARRSLLMEYYTFEDVRWRGASLVDLLVERLGAGVRLCLSYDGAGSVGTPDAVFERLRAAGAAVVEVRPFSPLRRRFDLWRVNDRDHRKILVADGAVGIMGGVNMSRVYENPRSAGAPGDAGRAFWYDCAARIEGPPVGQIRRLFLAHWRRQGGGPAGDGGAGEGGAGERGAAGGELVLAEGSVPRQRRQLYFDSLKAAVEAARSHVLLATGYFVPTHRQWRLLTEAAGRGVRVDLVLAGYSDIPSCTRAARALYGRMLTAGVGIHEMQDGMLHAKVAVIDGVWTAIGSSNLDRRSFVYNEEADAIILGRDTAGAVEAMLREWMGRAETVTLEAWRARGNAERLGELLTRVWSRYM